MSDVIKNYISCVIFEKNAVGVLPQVCVCVCVCVWGGGGGGGINIIA